MRRIPHDMQSELGKWIRLLVKEEKELALKNQVTTSIHGAHRACNFESRSLELRFSDKIVTPLLTGDCIQGTEGVPITLTLVDSHTKKVVTSGPEASGRVEIEVLNAVDDGVTEDDGRHRIMLIQHMKGKKSSSRNLCLSLIRGTAILPTVSFQRNERWMKISKIRLGAKFVDKFNGIQVKEAKTEPFVLKDRRTAANKKHSIPSLVDDIWRLYKVARKGSLARSLIQAKIRTVGDFLICLFRRPQRLKEIFDHANHAKSYKVTVKHAQECPVKLKYCSSLEQNTEVVFNVSGEVLGLYLNSQFLSHKMLSEIQKEVAKKLVFSAFENWGDVISINEDQFVAHYSPCLLSNGSSSNTGGHRPAKTVIDENWQTDESPIFGNILSDAPYPEPESIPRPLRRRYNEIYNGFESLCISNQNEPEPVIGFGTEAAHKKSRLSE